MLDFLKWCTALNYAVLIVWFTVLVLARGWVYRVHRTWFNLTDAQFDGFHYGLMGLYKLLILVFNLLPYLALRML